MEIIKKNIKELAGMSPDEWDAVCKNCGMCCLHKINNDGQTLFTRYACGHCDLKTRLCRKYAARITDDSCEKITVRDVVSAKFLPDSCAYVERVFGPAKNHPQINWREIKQNADCFEKLKASVFLESGTWASRTTSDIMPELLKFLDEMEL